MESGKGRNALPPEFILVPSRSRPGEFSYWSQALGQKFATLDLAWTAYDRMISAKRDPEISIQETIEVSSPARPSPRVMVNPASPIVGSRTLPPPSGSVSSSSGPFTDASFPPTSASIGMTYEENPSSRLRISKADRDAAVWVRLPEYIRQANALSEGTKVELFGNIEPHDLTQGVVGDCWLLATMACLAEFPNAVETLFCGTFEPSPIGKYTVRLFNLDTRQWEWITIDDHIPCRYENDYSEVPYRIREDGKKVYDASIPPKKLLKPLFAVPNGNQMWAALLEKAMAKFVGNYAMIAGGHEPFAMIAFTGFPQVYQYKRVPIDPAKTIAKIGEWERGWAQWAGKNQPCCGYRPALEELTFKNDDFFPKLLEYDRLNYLMAASIVCYPPPKTPDDLIRPDGLVVGHAYSLLAVEEFDTVRLVKLRNPHGRGSPDHPTEWNGRWSDESKEWDSHETIANCIGHERVPHDGIFWMEYSDFVSIFDKVLVLPYPMSEPRGALSSIRRAKLRASVRTVTQNGKAAAGMTLEHLTHIDEVVTAIHLMSIKPYDPYLNAPEWIKKDQQQMTRWAHEKLGLEQNKN